MSLNNKKLWVKLAYYHIHNTAKDKLRMIKAIMCILNTQLIKILASLTKVKTLLPWKDEMKTLINFLSKMN
jgi:ribosomal protein S4